MIGIQKHWSNKNLHEIPGFWSIRTLPIGHQASFSLFPQNTLRYDVTGNAQGLKNFHYSIGSLYGNIFKENPSWYCDNNLRQFNNNQSEMEYQSVSNTMSCELQSTHRLQTVFYWSSKLLQFIWIWDQFYELYVQTVLDMSAEIYLFYIFSRTTLCNMYSSRIWLLFNSVYC